MRAASDLSRAAYRLFGIEIEESRAERLLAFAELVSSWSDRMNLVSAESVAEILTRHVLDSLAPAVVLGEARTLADIGSGAGFPGVPLAVARPDLHVDLIESRRKRASFLRHALRTLEIRNARVMELRAEDWNPDAPPDFTTARAVRLDFVAEVSRRVLAPGGGMVVMRKWEATALAVPGFERKRTIVYTLPDGEKHEIVSLQRCST